ncbi:MAG: FAD-dependent oxidoreductase [Cyanobacteria bacterium J06639_1]
MKCDVAIVGCGVVGAAIAYELAKANLSVVAIDAGHPAEGATGAALGVMMAVATQQAQGDVVDLRLNSLQRFDPLIAELEDALRRSLPVNRRGLLRPIALDQWPKWEAAIAARRAAGYDLEVIEKADIQHLQPELAGWEIGLFSPSDRQIEPRVFALALLEAARQRGAIARFHAPVQAVKIRGDRVAALYTPTETIACGTAIVAAGVGSKLVGDMLGAPVPVVPVKGEAVRVRAPELSGGAAIAAADINLVPLPDGSHWIGATVEFNPVSPHPSVAGIQAVLQRAIALCPAIAQAELQDYWAGYRPRPSGQRAPILGNVPGLQNAILATGHYRNGVLLAPITAIAIRDLVLHGSTTACNLASFAPRSPERE